MNRRRLLTAGAAALPALPALTALSAWPNLARAADYPSRPIRLVVPFGPGGVADLTARAVGQVLGQKLGQSIVVENRPGAGGVVAGEVVAKSAPDGYTLLLMSNGTAVSAGLFKKLPFDPRRDFAPVSLLGQFDLAIVVPAGSRFKSLPELLAYAKQQPGKLNIGTVNIGSTQNLAAELLKIQAKVEAEVVPFNGTPAILTALNGGQVDAAVEILAPLLPQINGGSLRALAVLGKQRSPLLPQVPTVAESAKLADFEVTSWNALAAPAKTPAAVIERLNKETRAAVASPEVQKHLADLSVQPRASSPEELARLLDGEIKRWSDVITRAGVPRQ